MPTTEQDARALTFLACRIRKETHGAKVWDEPGTYAVVSRLIGTNLSTAIEQVTRHAADPEARTPGAIMRPFTPDAPTAPKRGAFPPKRDEECAEHVGELPPPFCKVHAVGDVRAWYDTDAPPPSNARPGDPRAGAALVRAGLRKAAGE